MFPHELKRLKQLEQEIYRCGVDGGESTGEAIEKLYEVERRVGVHDGSNKGPRWSNIDDIAIDKFCEFNDISITPALTVLNRVFNTDFFTNIIWYYWSDTTSCYKNDGNTQCGGKKYQALCSVGICRKVLDGWNEKLAWYHGNSTSVMNFSSEIVLRDEDKKIQWSSCEFKIYPYMINHSRKENSERICYTTHGSNITLQESDLLRACILVNENFEHHHIHKRLIEAMSNKL